MIVKVPRCFCSNFLDGAFVLIFYASSHTSCPISSVLMVLVIALLHYRD